MGGLFDGTRFERPVTCEVCERALAECRCPRDREGRVTPASAQSPRVQRERRSGGKTVTVIRGLDAHASDLPELKRELRKSFACGGAVDGGHIELQGDHRDRVVAWLIERGYRAKASGG